MINVSDKHGFIGNQFVLWHDCDFNTVERDESGCGKIDLLLLPASITMIIEAWIGGGLGDFDVHALIVERHVENVPRSAQVGSKGTGDIWLYFIHKLLKIRRIL